MSQSNQCCSSSCDKRVDAKLGKNNSKMQSFFCHILFIFFYIKLAVGNKTSADCGRQKFISSFGGTIQFARSDSSRKSCTYEINVPNNRRIVLKWKTFTVDGMMPSCRSSSVAVYIGCSSRKLTDFCSRNTQSLPHDVYSHDGCMKLVFYSSQATNEEFRAVYETYEADDPVSSTSYCLSKNYRTSKSGVIMSPKWPRKTTNLLSDECEWDIRVPSNYVIKMNFMDVDLYKTSSYYCRSSNTRLRLKGEKSVLTSYDVKEYYCGTKLPFSKTTRYYQLELEYKVGYYSRPRRGFAVGYIAYKTAETDKAAKSQTKIAYIGLGIAVIVLVSCCIFFAWRRRRRSQEAGRAAYHPPPSQGPTATITTYQKAPDYGSGPPTGAPPPYSASMTQPPYQGYPAQAYPPASQHPVAPYPTNAGPYPTSGAPYPPTSAPSGPYPGAAPYPGATAAPQYQADASYQPTAPYPTSQPPYPPTDTSGQAPYPTK